MKFAIWNLLWVLGLVLSMAFFGGYLTDRYSAVGDYLPYFFWLHFWAIMAGVYLAWDKVKAFFTKGKLRVSYQHMLVPLVYSLFCFTPASATYGIRQSGVMPLFAILAAYNLVSAFSRQQSTWTKKDDKDNKTDDETHYKQVTSRLQEY